MFFSPWLLVHLDCFCGPASLGDSHFAFLGYALKFMRTIGREWIPAYFGASKESTKELKLSA